MRIGELASTTGESVRTLRYWQDEGLLEADRTASGYRVFQPAMIDRVVFLRGAQALGLTLREIRGILSLRREGLQPCEHVRERLREHLSSVRERLQQLQALEEELEGRLAWANAHTEPNCHDGCVYLTDAAAGAPLR
ncbi:MAG: MerR family transcriptional regulator [Trueperaceae bacterium]